MDPNNKNTPYEQDLAISPFRDLKNTRKKHEKYETNSRSKGQRELMTGPQTMIVGDGIVKEVNSTKVPCFINNMVSYISETILDIVAKHPTAKSILKTQGPLMLCGNNLKY